MFSTIFSIVIAVLVCIADECLLRLMFGQVDQAVMQRSLCKSKVTMYISIIANIINVIGNVVVFLF